jgi:hypothetical protein
MLTNIFGPATLEALSALSFPIIALDGRSGARELHNGSRSYFDRDAIERLPLCRAVAEAFHAPSTIDAITAITGADLRDCYLRIEYAQDTDGFWLRPHTDLGVKRFTMLYYLGGCEAQKDLGTDIFEDGEILAKRVPFLADSAVVFVPSAATWHGFAPRPIVGVRKSIIINYVTRDWRAREQLCRPDQPVASL